MKIIKLIILSIIFYYSCTATYLKLSDKTLLYLYFIANILLVLVSLLVLYRYL